MTMRQRDTLLLVVYGSLGFAAALRLMGSFRSEGLFWLNVALLAVGVIGFGVVARRLVRTGDQP